MDSDEPLKRLSCRCISFLGVGPKIEVKAVSLLKKVANKSLPLQKPNGRMHATKFFPMQRAAGDPA
jgi:hypothetical protein